MRSIGAIATGLAAATMVGLAVGILWLHVSVRPVLSGSMRPAFAPGALLLTRQIPNNQVRPGDVIVLHPPGETSTYAHRVQTVSGTAHKPDPWHAQIVTARTTEVIGSVPWVGRIFVAAQRSQLLLIVFAGLTICAVGTRSILGPRPATRRARPVPIHV
jgi:signal peptidase I